MGFPMWKQKTRTMTTSGRKLYFYCAAYVGCQSEIYFLYVTDPEKILLFRNEHLHAEMEKHQGMDLETRRVIEELFHIGMKTSKALLHTSEDCVMQQPSLEKLKNFLSKLKKEKLGPTAVSFGDLEDWAGERQEVP